MSAATIALAQTGPGLRVDLHGRSFQVIDHPAAANAVQEFCSGFEGGTLAFFDAVLPHCDRMIDFGAYIGCTALYAAGAVAEVFAFEPSPTNYSLLARNVAINPELACRIDLFNHGLAECDGTAPLYAKARADSGSSLFRDIERAGLVRGALDAQVELRAAGKVLREIGIDRRTLLKIDIEGAEYEVLPAIADLLAHDRPALHVSFHPFNIVRGGDAYENAVARIGAAMRLAEVFAPYRYMHLYEAGAWHRIDQDDRLDFLRQYLLRAKHVARVASPQYGFTDALALSDAPMPELYSQKR